MPLRFLGGLFSSRESAPAIRMDVVDGKTIAGDKQMLVTKPSRLQGHTVLATAEDDARTIQMANVIYSKTAAMKAVWETGRAEAKLIRPKPGSGVKEYDLRATLREARPGEARTMELFLCEIRESATPGSKPPN